MQTSGTIFASSDCAGQVYLNHLPIRSVKAEETLSFPAPWEGCLSITFLPLQAQYLPLFRELHFSQGQPVLPLPDNLELWIWPQGLFTLRLHPQRVPTDFRVYPRILWTRILADSSDSELTLSLICREEKSLLLSRGAVPLVEVPLPAWVLQPEETFCLQETLIAVSLSSEDAKYAVIFRFQEESWQEILCVQMDHWETTEQEIVIHGCPDPILTDCHMLHRITPIHMNTTLFAADTGTHPGYCLLRALGCGDTERAQTFLSPELPLQELQRYLGHFQQVLSPPVSLLLDEGQEAWGLSKNTSPSQVRLFVCSCRHGKVEDIFEWE